MRGTAALFKRLIMVCLNVQVKNLRVNFRYSSPERPTITIMEKPIMNRMGKNTPLQPQLLEL